MKAPKWIGHKSARRCLTNDVCLYEDQKNQSFAIRALMHNVSLPVLDDFIEALEQEGVGAGRELRERRDKLHSDFLRHLEWITTRFISIRRSEKKARQVSEKNSANARGERPNARKIDHKEIEAEFAKLTLCGYTRREANGIIFNRGLASRPTITGITKLMRNDNEP